MVVIVMVYYGGRCVYCVCVDVFDVVVLVDMMYVVDVVCC